MMTFKSFPLQAAFTAAISSVILSHRPSFAQPMLMTMSTSSAPFATASEAMKHLAAVVSKPMTVQMGSLSPTYSFACFT